MATIHNIIELSTTQPTQLSDPSSSGSGRDITFQNISDFGYVYIGTSAVSSTDYGFRILPNTAISFELTAQDEIFAISENEGMRLAVISINLENEN
jgi:hypothetical protein